MRRSAHEANTLAAGSRCRADGGHIEMDSPLTAFKSDLPVQQQAAMANRRRRPEVLKIRKHSVLRRPPVKF